MIHGRSRCSGMIVVLAASGAAFAQTPLNVNFTYQGRLLANGATANGGYDLIFRLFDTSTGGSPMDSYAQTGQSVTDGLITADIYFTVANAFNGDQRWLEVAVRPAGLGSYTTLTPRQPLTATPYAHTAVRALSVDGVDGHSLDAVDGSPVDAVFVDASGNVGIGTTTPTDPLSIKPSANGGYLSLRNNNDGERWRLRLDSDHNLLLTAGSGERVRFGQANNSAAPSLTVFGTTRTNILNIVGGSDIAEPFNVTAVGAVSDRDGVTVQPGMVVSIDSQRVGELRLASQAYDATVAGVISGAGGVRAGLTLTQEDSVADGKHPVALTGRVWCWCDADLGGPIQAGDSLTTSDTPGHAMKVVDRQRAAGATIGKAMSPLDRGRGLVLVLVNLQ